MRGGGWEWVCDGEDVEGISGCPSDLLPDSAVTNYEQFPYLTDAVNNWIRGNLSVIKYLFLRVMVTYLYHDHCF